MAQKIALIALDVFRKSKKRAHQDQETGRIENVEMFAPGNTPIEGAWDRVFAQLPVK